MKLPHLLRLRESLASRISLWVVLYVVVIFTISAYVGDYFLMKLIREVQEHGLLHAITVRRLSLALTMVSIITLIVLTVAQGNLQAKLPVIRSKDEMQQLHHSFSLMQQSLERQMEELKQVNEAKGRIEGELKVARDIQMSMLPKTLDSQLSTLNSHLDICGQLCAAKEVGGDFYDFFIRDEKLFFCIGDVSGKGVPAALVMATTLSQFRNVTTYEEDLEKIIQSINKATCANNETVIFVTFFVGVLDLQSGQLQYCNAGHNKPFFVSDSITELPAKPDLPLGIDDGVAYVVREHVVPTGSMLFLYTDGLTEAMNAQREQFGRKRLADNLKSSLNCGT